MDELTQRMFKALDIPGSASITEIEARYRELVRKCQAAESSGDQEAWLRLKEISSAYEIVKKDWSARNVPQRGGDGYIRPESTAPAITTVRKKRSAASTAVVIGLVCIAIVYYGYGFMKKQSPPPAATLAQGELRLFMTSR